MSVPIILVSADCAIVHANPGARAVLEQGEVLASRHGYLASPVSGLQYAIGSTVRRLARDETDIPGPGVGLSIRAPDHSARTLHLLPLAQGATRAQLAGDAVAAIFVSSAWVGQDFAPDVLQSTFALTDAELGVLERILTGKSTREIAAELRIASSTVRTHVLHLFQKTATHSRADLVRIVHALAQPVAQQARGRPSKPHGGA